MKSEKKKEAIKLRKQGHSYNEICKNLGVAKSTCSVWLRGVKLNKAAIKRLVDRQGKGREKAALTLRQYAAERDALIEEKVEKLLGGYKFSDATGKLLCATLYWAEGEKKNSVLAFANSDPGMIKVYLFLLRRYFTVDERKISAILHLHSYHNINKQRKFWSKITGIPSERISIYRKQNSGKNIRKGYPGCISVRYYDVRLAKEVQFLYTTLVKKIDIAS